MGRVPDTSHADEFTLHPDGGPYGFIVAEIEEKTRESDREMVAILRLEPDTKTGDRGSLLHSFTLSDRFFFLLRRFLDAVGMPSEGGYDWAELVGKRVKAYIIHKEHKGKTYANVSEWVPYNTPTAPNPINSEDEPF
jgi:hypothetical protein